jgi:hypothetical protein
MARTKSMGLRADLVAPVADDFPDRQHSQALGRQTDRRSVVSFPALPLPTLVQLALGRAGSDDPVAGSAYRGWGLAVVPPDRDGS